jgi:hypothetical protein
MRTLGRASVAWAVLLASACSPDASRNEGGAAAKPAIEEVVRFGVQGFDS